MPCGWWRRFGRSMRLSGFSGHEIPHEPGRGGRPAICTRWVLLISLRRSISWRIEHEIHTLPDALTRPVAVILTPGQSGDNPQLEPLLDLHRQQYPASRGPSSGCRRTRPIRIRRPERSCGPEGPRHNSGTAGPERPAPFSVASSWPPP